MPPVSRSERKSRLFAAGSLEGLLEQPEGLETLRREASDPESLLTSDQVRHLQALLAERRVSAHRLGAFFSNADVILVPGFMGSTLSDTEKLGLIWIDPRLFVGQGGAQLSALMLGKYDPDRPDQDLDPNVRIECRNSIPIIYDLLTLDLEVRRYDVQVFPFDWRKDLERSAMLLADRIRGRLGQRPRPLHLVAHSQGSLVARRAVQMLGPDVARQLVNTLVLLGPASFGSLAAAFGIAGNHSSLQSLIELGVKVPDSIGDVLRSFTGLYQLLPWKADTLGNGFDPAELGEASYWKSGVDKERLNRRFAWGREVDTEFFNDRTTIILGDQPTTGAVRFEGKTLIADPQGDVWGDGTVPDLCALLPGVQSYRAKDAEHLKLPLNRSVLSAVRAILRGDQPRIRRDGTLAAAATSPKHSKLQKETAAAIQRLNLTRPVELAEPPEAQVDSRSTAARESVESTVPFRQSASGRPEIPQPTCRRLRVFSFDPLLATDLSLLDIAEIAIEVPWEEPGRVLGPGPVGEYLEVVDADPGSGRFYHPVDLNDPRLAAQDGLPAAESNPQFHQQMTYAVGMATIATFEKALGRVALWAPRLQRNEDGSVKPRPSEEKFVRRLRVYPHALREANAFYDPDRHALLFGYFPSREAPGGKTLPRGTVFTCQSFDVIAHETTHALLHGLHRYYLYHSNSDVFAFHEAFADAVALFQHFSHEAVVRHQVAQTRGDLRRGNLLGQLAQQFGYALGGKHGALRKYLGEVGSDGKWSQIPADPSLYSSTSEPHDRGAILMAALFRAFMNIYESRTRDLYRIATGGTGVLPDGDIHPDLVNRLAGEAVKSAKHILTMCVRALDYVPPVDLTFGEYLRALITADFDLVHNDDRGYRASVIDAFRQWGIYPSDVNVLDETALRWRSPPVPTVEAMSDAVKGLPFTTWNLRADRRETFLQMAANGAFAHRWILNHAHTFGDNGESLGLLLGGDQYQSVPRKNGRPKFEVHSLRPCSRIGPDGQQRVDLVAEILQRRAGFFAPAKQEAVEQGKVKWTWSAQEAATAAQKGNKLEVADFVFRGGCTLIIDPESGQIRYCIRKSILSKSRLDRQREYEQTGVMPGLAMTYLGPRSRTPFAMLHTSE